MGLFDTIRKSKEVSNKAEWRMGAIPVIVELNDDHMKLITSTVTNTIFYGDIMSVEQAMSVVNIKTNVKDYSLLSKGLRGGTAKATELSNQILEKMAEYKK